MSKKLLNNYSALGVHYEKILEKYGDTEKGMDWKNKRSSNLRFKVMQDLFLGNINKEKKKISLLDFGCGTSKFFEYLKNNKRDKFILYSGLDINKSSLEIAKKKFPDNTYIHTDILDKKNKIKIYDYIIINGLFTQKLSLSNKQMNEFMQNILNSLSNKFKIGLSFNILSENVDYKNKFNFYPKADKIESFLCNKLSRNFIVRHDYGLYEKTYYLYKDLFK